MSSTLAKRGEALLVSALLAAGCTASAVDSQERSQAPLAGEFSRLYGYSVVMFQAGPGAGFGAEDMPAIVLGPPQGQGTGGGSLDVVSLGVGGEITLEFDRVVVDGPGADLVVFENPFWAGGDPKAVFAELGEVAVSENGTDWHIFPCETQDNEEARWPGCAGWTPTLAYDPLTTSQLDPALTGGDAFDLATLGIQEARFIRITDLATDGAPPTAGFDLDAVGLIHFREP